METQKTRFQSIRELPQQVKDDFIEQLVNDAERFEALNSDFNLSYSKWFKTYVLSDDFKTLSKDKQKEVFEHYENISIAFKSIVDFFTENEVVNYKGNLQTIEIQ